MNCETLDTSDIRPALCGRSVEGNLRDGRAGRHRLCA